MTAKKRKLSVHISHATHRWAKMIMMENIQIMTTINQLESVTQKNPNVIKIHTSYFDLKSTDN